jgi:beta-glucosidase-like glycosyl hydrolase
MDKRFYNCISALTCLAATFNPTLSKDYGISIGEEVVIEKKMLLGPGVNMYRSPLNGRNFEYMGEDPYLASKWWCHTSSGTTKWSSCLCETLCA